MLSKICTCALLGLSAQLVIVETDFFQGLPGMKLVGLPDTMVRESCDRIKPAIINSGYPFPLRKITINLAPANTRKDGSHFDLPIAMGILASAGIVNLQSVENCAFLGELSLDGRLQRIEGALPMIIGLAEKGVKQVFVPRENAEEAGLVKGVEVYPADTLKEVVEHFSGKNSGKIPVFQKSESEIHTKRGFSEDYSDVKGQDNVKRAVVISCSGNHGLIMRGEPGSGKTMIAKRIPTVLPQLTYEECLEVTKIYSVLGKLSKEEPFIEERPFRAPHHTISSIALVGGGRVPRPGELSLAHKGVLFLDELPEFNRNVLETLRQPLEEKSINISRITGNYVFPCDFMMVAAANPCPCGFYGSKEHECTCSPGKIDNYNSRLSGPLLDRFDLHVEVLPVQYESISFKAGGGSEQGNNISSEQMRKQVERAREIQKNRYINEGIEFNSQLHGELIKKYCSLDDRGEALLKMAFKKLGLSARGYVKILKVARTIADLDESEHIKEEHVAEAFSYRMTGYKGV